ncbi:TerD family protein [Actinomadura scrupuli]|uniref:TerD family protein n=1 Tax=Actinomadura scrupuli TaxID=559629 RepID=UPI003D973B2F
MADLIRGANTPLDAARVVATVSCAVPVDVSALLVGTDLRVRSDADLVFYNEPEAAGVRWSDSGGEQRIEVDLTAVPAGVQAVLVAVSLTGATSFGAVPAPRLRLTAAGGEALATFSADGLGPEKAIIGLELYRRGGGWKVRAVGQGYAGGLAELVTAHGVEVDDSGEPATAAPPSGPPLGPAAGVPPTARSEAAPAGPAPGNVPPGPAAPSPVPSPTPSSHEVGYAERVWLVWEDASRSLAAFRAASRHALTIRGDEIAGRASPGRYQQLLDAAGARLNGDVEHLRAELAGAEPHASPEIAPFASAGWLTWRPRPDPAEGVLLGHLTTDEAPGLRVPLVLRLPWRRAVWISQGVLPGDSTAFTWSLVTRFLAAVPPGTTGVEVIDATGLSGAGWLNGLAPAVVSRLLGGGVSTGPAATDRLGRLLDLVDLRRVGADDTELPGPLAGGPPVRLVVVFDAGAALSDSGDADRLLRLVEDGPLVGVPVVLVETGSAAAESVRTMRLRQSCHNLPSSEGTIADPWVGSDWTVTPEVLPDAGDGTRTPALLAHVLGAHARAAAGA